MNRQHVFEFYNHRVTIDYDFNFEMNERPSIEIVDGPYSVPLSITNGFEFMLENNVRVLVMDGTEIRRIT